jgi:tetratricopeptide (TPR) repeat protein
MPHRAASEGTLTSAFDSAPMLVRIRTSGTRTGGAPFETTMTSTSLGSGMRIGSYQIETVLGMGTEARVLAARSASGERVVLKVFADDVARRDHEVGLRKKIGAAGLPAVQDVGRDETHGAYFVMRYVEGTSARALAARQPFLPEHALACLLPVVETLAQMHARGVVHGDVKPEHIIVTPSGEVSVLDLGLAFEIGASRASHGVSGTLGYIAPETFEALPPSSAVDVFAIGVVLFELVTGARPFEQTRGGHTHDDAPRLDAVDGRASRTLSDLVARCLASSPEARPSCDALRTGLLNELAPVKRDVGAIRKGMLADREGTRAKTTRKVVEALVRDARACVDDGDAFAATRLLDRALAYAPEDAAALAALDHAMRPPRVSKRTLRRGIALGLVLSVVVALAYAYSRRAKPSVPAPTRTVPVVATERHVAIEDFVALPRERLPNATLVQGDLRKRNTLRTLDARVRANPRDRETRRRRADLRLELGRVRDAHADLIALLDEDPNDLHALRSLTALYDRVGESARTAPLLERIVGLRPRDADALTDLSIAYGQTPEGSAAIERAYVISPRSERVLARRCSLAVHASLADAIERCDAASRRSPRNPFVLGDLAEAHLVDGDPRAAKDALSRALVLRPDDVPFLWRREALERALGEDDEARATRALVCSLEPDPRCEP